MQLVNDVVNGAAVLTRGRPSGIPAGALLDFSTLETVKVW